MVCIAADINTYQFLFIWNGFSYFSLPLNLSPCKYEATIEKSLEIIAIQRGGMPGFNYCLLSCWWILCKWCHGFVLWDVQGLINIASGSTSGTWN